MKRLVYFGLFILGLIILFLFFSNRVKNYEVVYKMNDYEINESFNKNDKSYYFKLSSQDEEYNFVIDKKYSKKREIIDKIDVLEEDNTKCVNITVDKYTTPYICKKNDIIVDAYLAGVKEESEDILAKEVDNISIFEEGNYYLWNGYGLTDIINNKQYNFLDKESYDNNISYQYNEYLLVADYDASREFSKFYIFNSKTNKISEFEFEYKISFSSYFMGDMDDAIYLFDKKNKVQYKIIIGKKEKIEIVSTDEAANIYDDEWDMVSLNKLVYNDLYFKKSNLVNYSLDNKKLYYNYRKNEQLILIDQDDISGIIHIHDNDVYYLKKDTLYKYNYHNGKSKIMSYFEWNFSYNNKIFIFD